MSEPFSAERIVYLRPNRLLAAWPLAVALGPLAFLAAFQAHTAMLAGLAPLFLLVGLLGLVSGRLVNRSPGRIPGRVVAGPDGVSLDGRRLASRGEIRSGLVVPHGLGPPMVRLERGLRRPIELEVADEAEGRALLTALGLDASQTVATFRTPSRVLTDRAYRVAFIFSIVGAAFVGGLFQSGAVRGASPAGLFLRLGLFGAIIAFSTFSRSRIDVGADGILTSWLGVQKRFVPYREIAGAASYIDETGTTRSRYLGVVVTTTLGETIRMPVAQIGALNARDRVNGILERIREAMATYQRGEVTASAAVLDRGDRDVAAWIRALRAVGSGAAADHRTAPVLPEQLWRIVEDPSQKPELRAGAAVVLGGALDDEGRARLRVTAGAVAEPKVRIAIEAAGGDDEEALAEALADLPREMRGAPRR